MCQVHAGAYVSLLTPEETSYSRWPYIVRVCVTKIYPALDTGYPQYI